MPSNAEEIINANIYQSFSETDGFTVERYKQFIRHLPAMLNSVLDVGCNTGRGGQELKKWKPGIDLIGLDCVRARVDSLDPNIYSKGICSFTQNIEADTASFDAVVAGEFI